MATKKQCPYCGGYHYRARAFRKCAKRHQTLKWKKLKNP